MTESATRLLSLLSLLQVDRGWTGERLAERLGVSPRTVRNDIERLRSLGYDVQAERGAVGGYRLGPGGQSPPPLLLDAEEAVAVAVGLRTGVNCIIGGMEEPSLRALAKLEQVLPSRLRQRVRNLNRYTVPLPVSAPLRPVDPEVLTLIVGLCHRQERLRFFYEGQPSPSTERTTGEEPTGFDVEPYRIVSHLHRWYLLGFDVSVGVWQLFEVDRMRPRTPAGPGFVARELPADDITAYVAALVPEVVWRCRGEVLVHAPSDAVRAAILPAEGLVEPADDRSCRLHVGAEDFRAVALILGRLPVPFTVLGPAELRDEVAHLGQRLATAADPDRAPA